MEHTWTQYYNSLNDAGRAVVDEHREVATRIHTFTLLRSHLIEEIHWKKCFLANGEGGMKYLPTTKVMQTIYDELIFLQEDGIVNREFPLRSYMDSLLQRELGAINQPLPYTFNAFYYEQCGFIPKMLWSTQYSRCNEWRLSPCLEITPEDISLFIEYKRLYIELLDYCLVKIKACKVWKKPKERIKETENEKARILKIMNSKSLVGVLNKTRKTTQTEPSSYLYVLIHRSLQTTKKIESPAIKESSNKDEEGVYIIQEREFIGRSVYKIGRSTNMTNRGRQYPKGSIIILQLNTKQSLEIESKLIMMFCDRFRQCKEYGTEYFEGDRSTMIRLVVDTVLSWKYNKKPSERTTSSSLITLIPLPQQNYSHNELIDNDKPSRLLGNKESLFDILGRLHGDRRYTRESLLDMRQKLASSFVLFDYNGDLAMLTTVKKYDYRSQTFLETFHELLFEQWLENADRKAIYQNLNGETTHFHWGEFIRSDWNYYWWDRYKPKAEDPSHNSIIDKIDSTERFDQFIEYLEQKIKDEMTDDASDESSESGSDEESGYDQLIKPKIVYTVDSVSIIDERRKDKEIECSFNYTEHDYDKMKSRDGLFPNLIIDKVLTSDNVSGLKDNKILIDAILARKRRIKIEHIEHSPYHYIQSYKDVYECLSNKLVDGEMRPRRYIGSYLDLLLNSNAIVNDILPVRLWDTNEDKLSIDTLHDRSLFEPDIGLCTLRMIGGKYYTVDTLMNLVPCGIEYNDAGEYCFYDYKYNTIGESIEPSIPFSRVGIDLDVEPSELKTKINTILLRYNLTKCLNQGIVLYDF